MSAFLSTGELYLQSNYLCYLFCILILILGLLSLRRQRVFLLNTLHPYTIKTGTRLYRILSAGFVHRNFQQLSINLLMMLIYGSHLETWLVRNGNEGHWEFAAIFLLSIITSNMITVLLHKKDLFYSSAGSSGGILAIMASYLILNPHETLIQIPLIGGISNFVTILIYIAGSIYLSVRKNHEQISHELHLLGCLAGVAVTLILHPYLINQNI